MSQWKGRARIDGRTHTIQICAVFTLLLAPLAQAGEENNAAKSAAADVKTAEGERTKPPPARMKRLLVFDPTPQSRRQRDGTNRLRAFDR